MRSFEAYTTSGKTYSKEEIECRFAKDELYQRVRVQPLDVILREEGIPMVDIIKIDVECFEEEVVKGAKILLGQKGARCVICELNNEESKERVVGMFRDVGYTPHIAKWDGSLQPVTGAVPSGNVVFM